MITDGKICICDLCNARWIFDPDKPLKKRCISCRTWRWNSGGQDKRKENAKNLRKPKK
jgi:hypothetical protein